MQSTFYITMSSYDQPSNVILLVEDDKVQAELVVSFFERENFNVITTMFGDPVPDLIRENNPEVILLDLKLPDVDGLEVAREVRKISNVPIIFLTARNSEIDKVLGLEIGGDDYMTKPFSLRELHARIRAVTRRSAVSSPLPSKIEAGPYLIDWSRREVRNSDSSSLIVLTSKELELLWFLATNANAALTRDQLFDKVWGSAAISSSRTLDVHVANLRRKLPGLNIITVRGTGYRLDLVVEQ